MKHYRMTVTAEHDFTDVETDDVFDTLGDTFDSASIRGNRIDIDGAIPAHDLSPRISVLLMAQAVEDLGGYSVKHALCDTP